VEPGKYDLVITNMTMPPMTGIELPRALRAVRPDLPVILCTGYSELITREDAEKEGVSIFVEKPYSTTNIIEIMNKYFQRNQW
jgi:FixJ family two-component response regulator